MKILKFGGTSVGTTESILNVKKIVETQAASTTRLIVVVSALGGITDMLIQAAVAAGKGDDSHIPIFDRIASRHRQMVANLFHPETAASMMATVDKMLGELLNIYTGVSLIKDLSDRTLDIIVSYGERMSAAIVARLIDHATLFDSRQFIKTTSLNNRHILDAELTDTLIDQYLGKGDYTIAIVPGFIASSATSPSRVTNLGRGGSDYTAAIIAARLKARALEIWTDVDGFMTADPRIINKTYVIDRLSYTEAIELCNFGAKVIYPPTIYPVYHADIPLYIKNTFNPEAPGTLITRDIPAAVQPSRTPVRGISSINDTSLVTVSGLGMVGVKGINARIFSALTSAGVSVFLVAQASSENNTSIGIRTQDVTAAVTALNREFAPEIALGEINPPTAGDNLATIAIVGESMKDSPTVAGRMFNTLGRNGIRVISFAQGASGINISAVISRRHLIKALNVLHDTFFLSDASALNIFLIGTGNIGTSLLRQIASQQENLMINKSLRLQVVGISNSRHCVFDPDGIDIPRYRELLDSSQTAASPKTILDNILGMNIHNPVFVDCTSSADIAALYPTLLDHNVNIVAANKIASSGDLAGYLHLKELSGKRDVKFLFETNVGAGLPVINTINSLINSGDRIIKIEAVLSGTLNYIFNTISDKITLSQAVRKSITEGYAEPDPRVDLSGLDVVRKIVILAREAGYSVSTSDVRIEPIIPPEIMDAPTVESFLTRLAELDQAFEQKRLDAVASGSRYRYVAALEDGHVSAGLKSVEPTSPFYTLEGSNNIILLTTERYRQYPMEIKGYGAGAEVTAAGVFADIISIANIR